MLVHVLMTGGVLTGAVSVPVPLFAVFEGAAQIVPVAGLLTAGLMVAAAVWLTPQPFSPEYIMAMRTVGGIAASSLLLRRR